MSTRNLGFSDALAEYERLRGLHHSEQPFGTETFYRIERLGRPGVALAHSLDGTEYVWQEQGWIEVNEAKIREMDATAERLNEVDRRATDWVVVAFDVMDF